MKDLFLWQQLHKHPFHEDELVPLLDQLAKRPLANRIPFFASLQKCVQIGTPALQEAALKCLSEAAGHEAYQLFVEYLDSDDENLREAAVQSMAESANLDPARWVHVMFHPRPETRRLAVLHRPELLQAENLLLLLPDQQSRQTLLEELPFMALPLESLRTLLEFVDKGLLQPDVCASAILRICSEDSHNEIHNHLEIYAAFVPGRTRGNLEKAVAYLDEWQALNPLLLRFYRLFWNQSDDRLFQRLWRQVEEGQLGLTAQTIVSGMCAHLGVSTGQWTNSRLALAALAVPIVLSHASVTPDSARDVALSHLEKRRAFIPSNPLEGLAQSPLCLTSDGSVDLETTAGLLGRNSPGIFGRLLENYSFQELLDSLVASPEKGFAVLQLEKPSREDLKVRKRLVDGLLDSQSPADPALVALLAVRLVGDAFPQLQRLGKQGEAYRANVLQAMLTKHRAVLRTLPVSRQEGLAERFAATWTLQTFPHALDVLLENPELKEVPFVHHFLALASRRCPKTTFERWIRSFTDAQMTILTALVDYCPGFPTDKHWILTGVLASSPVKAFREWVERYSQGPPVEDERRARESNSHASLTREQAVTIWSAPDAEIKEALAVIYTQPTRGLCQALEQREPKVESALEICTALLVCADSPRLVADSFQRFRISTSSFVDNVERLLAARCARMTHMPLLGNALLHRWDPRLLEFEKQVLASKEGLLQVLRLGTTISDEWLASAVWEAVLRLMKRWRWHRSMPTMGEVFDLALGKFLCAAVTADFDKASFEGTEFEFSQQLQKNRFAARAARLASYMLVQAHASGKATRVLDTLRPLLINELMAVDAECRTVLSNWIDSEGVQAPAEKKQTVSADQAKLDLVQSSSDLEFLARCCRDSSLELVQEAALRLLQLGRQGSDALVDILLSRNPAVHQHTLAFSAALVEDGEAIQRLRNAVQGTEIFAETAFRVGIALLSAGHADLADSVFAAVNRPTALPWFFKQDWEALCSLGFKDETLVFALVESPHYDAYTRCVRHLLQKTDRKEEKTKDALRRFLLAGDKRAWDVRCEVAQALRKAGVWTGAPILFSQAFKAEFDSTHMHRANLWTMPDHILLDLFRSSLIAGNSRVPERNFPHWARLGRLGDKAFAELMQAIIDHGTHPDAVYAATAAITRHSVRNRKCREVAGVFAWGVREAQQLTRRLFSIHICEPDQMGHTDLDTTKLYVSPLPLLRAERDGRQVVQGLVLHELGHHLFHADEVAKKTWDDAKEQSVGALLNLVADEHLERNMRATSQGFGHDLKKLNAYAFMHMQRCILVRDLMPPLGANAFDVLSKTPLAVARQYGSTVVNSGAVLSAMEKNGSSLARFMKALRMGLGNRHDDPKVARALALFTRRFRKMDMTQLLELAHKLRAIFTTEADEMELFRNLMASQVSAAEMAEELAGLDDEDLQKAVERLLQGKQKNKGQDRQATGEVPGRALNLGSEATFPVLHDIRRVQHDPDKHRAYARQVKRWSTHLSAYLQRLGLGLEPEGERLSGTRLDRSKLLGAITRGDPRILQARRLVRRNDLFLGVLIDCSGSMELGDHIELAKLFGVLIAEATSGISGIESRFFGFTDEVLWDAGTASRCAVHNLEAWGGNNDAGALWHMASLAGASRKASKLIVMISDGSPTECTVESLRQLVQRLTVRRKITCAQVAVYPLEHICFPHYVDLSNRKMAEAVAQFGKMVANLVGKTISGG